MKENPEKMTLAKLSVLVMPNGEILCNGRKLGYVTSIGEYLSELRDATTGEKL